jgi:hypothetical protein
MKHPEVNPAPCPAGGTPGPTEMLTGGVTPPGPAGAASSPADRSENLPSSWEQAWIDIGGEG